jgi:hypothetical protein
MRDHVLASAGHVERSISASARRTGFPVLQVTTRPGPKKAACFRFDHFEVNAVAIYEAGEREEAGLPRTLRGKQRSRYRRL